ncbi:leucyl aminopeptidase family protein [Kordiimonas aquimaris]|uniref:leucyl aminopeptidase family protein n=1 Tax=Kordiimonas aquimaris TaxID=707591 RepID=UPI0021CF3ADD|nr:leucyl aminopeptidase family protein [Kordiimonas aquimaris]
MPLLENCLSTPSDTATINITPITTTSFDTWLMGLPTREKTWIQSTGFTGKGNTSAIIANVEGAISHVYVGCGTEMPVSNSIWWLAAIVDQLPEGQYVLPADIDQNIQQAAALGWCMAHYVFDRYKSADSAPKVRTLIMTDQGSVDNALRTANAMALVRDLVNTPAEDMGPSELQEAAEMLAEANGGTISTIVGDDLLDENFPAIHAVGRAAAEGREPRLIDLSWGNENAPRLTIVGKGVCFDTGGLDIKPGAGMRLMKKDMGGAAHALGLAQLIIENDLDVNLRVLIPAVENAIAGDAYRPSDIIMTRKGLSVEIGNTDAEGRVVLCDALALACEENPSLIIDFATLTGAARVALGADLPATYTNNDDVWNCLDTESKTTADPLWRMPLWAPYDESLDSRVADICNISNSPLGGSITAALYLQRFIEKDTPWVHFDVFAWSDRKRAGRPVGGDAQGVRATYAAIKRYLDI